MSQGQLRRQSPASDQVFDYRVESQGETVRVNLGGNEIELAVKKMYPYAEIASLFKATISAPTMPPISPTYFSAFNKLFFSFF